MNAHVSRMQFLRGDFKGKALPLRPPWAIDESLFVEICNHCGDCVSNCPTHIIKLARADFPVVDFLAGECLFCEQCVDACKPKALLKLSQSASHSPPPWTINASINKDSCIAHKNVECRSCYDPCDARAISMTPQRRGISIPAIRIDDCTGCGACISVCPVQAISMQPQLLNSTQLSQHN